MKHYLIQKILDKYEKSSVDWKEVQTGNRSVRIQQEDYDCMERMLREQEYEVCREDISERNGEEMYFTGKECLLKEAVWLENQKLIKIKWRSYKNDIELIRYSLEKISLFYKIAERIPKFEKANTISEIINGYSGQTKSEWLQNYYHDQMAFADNGKKTDYEKYKEELFLCLNALEKLEFPMYVRIFSSRYLKNSKTFENKLKARVISIAKKYHPMVDDVMEKYQVLEQLYLDTYSQELAFKGALKICLEGLEIDFTPFVYGAVLNSETLKKAEILYNQEIRKIVTVENKANFVSMPYEKDTLIIFSHGFFSPLERDFLKRLEQKLEENRTGQTEYYHTGDLDYGGIRIFQYIRKQIFPKLQPYQMSVEQYEKYKANASDIKESALKKLKGLKEPLLQELIDAICREKKVVEQESFLYGEDM